MVNVYTTMLHLSDLLFIQSNMEIEIKENRKKQRIRLGDTVFYGFEIQVRKFHLITFQYVVSMKAFQAFYVTDVIYLYSVDAYGFEEVHLCIY